MLTKQELINHIQNSVNQSWEPEAGLKFTMQEDETVYVDWSGKNVNFRAFIMKHNGDAMGEFYLANAGNLRDTNDLILFIKKIAKHVGYELKIDEAQIVEKPVIDNKEESRLTGKVEAYEKILINRELTISK